jgi:ubiquitin-protein ligase
MRGIKQNRLKFEYEDLKKYNQFKVDIDPNNNNVWYVQFKGAEKTLYENEEFKLRFQFDEGYVSNKYYLMINIIIK